MPAQQSALFEQAPHAAMQSLPEHTNGGAPPATGFGTHGTPPQQFALDAHAPPAETHCAPAHRGTPTLSCLQVSWVSQLPLQQSHEELHDMTLSLHTSPSGLQPIGFRQMPSVEGEVISHVTPLPEPPGRPAEPQQSESAVQRSPTTWQPLAGWQTRTPVGPHGAQARLQHGPPHAGSPASLGPTAPLGEVPPQSCPSTTPQLAGPLGGFVAHVPSDAPAARVHVPVQQSVPAEHESPAWPQNDDAWHVPFEQSFEQHSPPEAHWLPSVLHVAFKAAHVPAAQF